MALDGLRGAAALLVVFLHAEWPSHLTGGYFVRNGFVAVDLFFILSGFVIAANYSARISNLRDAWNFIGLRFFRLYPIHVFVLAAFVSVECAKLVAFRSFGIASGPQPPFTADNSYSLLLANLFLVHGLPPFDHTSWNGASWSISCEFAAYVMFVTIALAGLSRNKAFLFLACILAVAGHAGIVYWGGTLDITVEGGLVRCFAGFLIGMFIFEISNNIKVARYSVAKDVLEMVVFAAAVSLLAVTSGARLFLVIPLFAVGIFLLQSDRGPVARILMTAPMQFLGRISYSVYMIHSFIVVCILIVLKRGVGLPQTMDPARNIPLVVLNPWVGDLLVLILAGTVLATSSVTYALIEEPGRLLGRKLFLRLRRGRAETARG